MKDVKITLPSGRFDIASRLTLPHRPFGHVIDLFSVAIVK